MDKNRMYDVKKRDSAAPCCPISCSRPEFATPGEKADGAEADASTAVHRIPSGGMQTIHRNYGLWIIGGGSGKTGVDSFDFCRKRYFEFFSLSHMYDGAGKLWLAPDTEIEISPGDCVLICPDVINRYGGSRDKPYVEDSLRFCGPVADMLMKSGIISSGTYPLGRIRRLLPIIRLAADPAVGSQISANIELQKLLVDLYLGKRMSSAEHPQFEKLMEEIRSHLNKWWTVGEMAELCNMSDDQMRRLFIASTGMRPKVYVDRLKLRRAAEMLAGTDMKISEIAETLGYLDPYHFSRRFKKIMGISPLRYRESAPDAMRFSGPS